MNPQKSICDELKGLQQPTLKKLGEMIGAFIRHGQGSKHDHVSVSFLDYSDQVCDKIASHLSRAGLFVEDDGRMCVRNSTHHILTVNFTSLFVSHMMRHIDDMKSVENKVHEIRTGEGPSGRFTKHTYRMWAIPRVVEEIKKHASL